MHVPFEGPGIIADWTRQEGHHLEYTRFYDNDPLPDADSIDLLVIMGGPMNVFDYHIHPWMEDEIKWIQAYIEGDKPLLGICLGAQIVAAALGADVYPGPQKEIGWFNLRFLPAMGEFRICETLPSARKVFHWHGDTFDIPKGAVRIAESRVFPNQGFLYNRKVLALQFHLEVTTEAVKGMIQYCGDELVDGPFIQSAKEIRSEKRFLKENQYLMVCFLDYLSSQRQSASSAS
jgi:GMP synthase (glutamine-hydrolysing)